MDKLLIFNIAFIALLLFIALVDIGYKSIPNLLNLSLLALAIYFKFPNFEEMYLAAAIYVLPMIFIYGYGSDLFKREVLGFGDIKLCLALAIVLYNPIKDVLIQIYLFYFLSFVPAAVIILILLILSSNRRRRIKTMRVAFAPFLAFSFLVNYFAYDYIIDFINNYVF